MNKKISIIVGLLFVLSLIAACTGSNSEANNAQEQTQTAQEETANEPAQEETAPAMEEKAEAKEEQQEVVEEKTVEDASGKLQSSLSANVQYSAVYDYTSKAQGQTMSGKMTMYLKNTNFRSDTQMTVSGQNVEAITIVTDEAVTCTKQSGDWSCMKFEYNKDEDSASSAVSVQENLPDYTITALPGRTVAGVSTDCYKLVYKPSAKDYDATFEEEYCHSKEGVPLYVDVKGTAEGQSYSTKMVASSYKTSVPDSTFTPPAEPQSMDDLINSYQGGAGMPSGYDIPNY